jgi:predicted Zn-dependent protease
LAIVDSAQRAALVARLIERSDADETEVIVAATDSALTRFTRNAIHQNVATTDTIVRLRVVRDGKTGVASTNDLAEEALSATLARAELLARHAPRADDTQPMVAPARVEPVPNAYDAATANATAEQRAAVAAAVFEVARCNDMWAAGFVSTAAFGITIANARGTLQSFDATESGLAVKQNASDSTGYAERFSTALADLDGTAAAQTAAQKAAASADPIDVPARDWTVVLEPAAAAEFLDFLASHFSALMYDQGSSFFSGRLGERFMGDNVAIADDVRHPLNPGMPFDFEGAPTRRVPLIEGGVVREIVTDARWARKLGRENTGHALAEPNAAGPQARHLVVAPGTASLDELIAGTERGILISRLWYARTVDQRKTIVTGMTRDGTFLIEDGRVGRGLRNMRFNQSVVEALADAQFGRDLARTSSYAYSLVLPAVKFERFRFTSGTDF